MTGATVGVAVLGAVYGLAGGASGLRRALLLGGSVQLACAAFAWVTTGPARSWHARSWHAPRRGRDPVIQKDEAING